MTKNFQTLEVEFERIHQLNTSDTRKQMMRNKAILRHFEDGKSPPLTLAQLDVLCDKYQGQRRSITFFKSFANKIFRSRKQK